MEPKINYVALLILIILGVAIGNLTSSWFTTKYNKIESEKETAAAPKVSSETPPNSEKSPELKEAVKPKQAEIIRETVKLSPENQAEPVEKNPPANSEELIEQRRLDENGLRLSKRCNEWTTVHKDMNTPSSERGMNKHCAEYYDYLSFGNLPNTN